MKIISKVPARRRVPKNHLRVAAVQFRSETDLARNVARMSVALASAAKKGAQVAVFPECALTGYTAAAILAATAQGVDAGERELARVCRQLRIAAIVGTPEVAGRRRFNAAVIIGADGRPKARYRKEYLVGGDRSWQCAAGDQAPPVFRVAGVPASVIVCHDNRYPELCRLPVLVGAQIIFYVSHEGNLTKRSKLGPCRAQVQARAVENNVFIVHANAPSDGGALGSHGESRIVGPDGNILVEACQREEEILVADLDLRLATRSFALNSLRGPHRQWWRQGMRKVPIVR